VHLTARKLCWDQKTAETNIDGKNASKIRRTRYVTLLYGE
jgi:hypothetical protein